MESQTATPLLAFYSHHAEWKAKLVDDMVGKRLDQLRTPSLVIDKTVLERNCKKLSDIPTKLNTKVRVHIKTHKSIEGTRIQLEGAKSDAIVVSTMAEAQAVINSDLVDHLLKDVLLGFPITPDKFNEIFILCNKVATFQVFIDNISTVESLEAFCRDRFVESTAQKVKAFLKVDCGYGRAGVPMNDHQTIALAKRMADSPYIDFTGIYTHAGHSYSSANPAEALEYLKNECDMARKFRDYFMENGIDINYVSIGATPTVKAITAFMQDDSIDMKTILEGIHEVHAGAFAFLDKQQVHTGLGTWSEVAISVACRVASIYNDRSTILIDGGGLAFSKDTAPQGGFGFVVDPAAKDEQGLPKIIASVNKVSQEHGIVQLLDNAAQVHIGQVLRIIPNHCCLAAACHLFYLITENGRDTVVDVWVPVRGW